MNSTTAVTCGICGIDAPDERAHWFRCPSCRSTYCADCPGERRESAIRHGECDSTTCCPRCGSIALNPL